MNNKLKNIVNSISFVLCLLILSSCTTSLRNLKDGETLPESSNGLLVGMIHWQQAGRPFGSLSAFEIRNIGTHKNYVHAIEGAEFRLSLPPGKYDFTHFYALDPDINTTIGRNLFMFTPLLLNIATVPQGFVLFLTFGNGVIITPPLYPFEISPNKVTYIGTLTINLPDPLPIWPTKPEYRISDEGDRILADLQSRFPEIKTLEKQLLFKTNESTIAPYPVETHE